MAGDGRASAVGVARRHATGLERKEDQESIHWIDSSLPIQRAAVPLEMPDQVAAFHVAGDSIVRVSQTAEPGASRTAFSR